MWDVTAAPMGPGTRRRRPAEDYYMWCDDVVRRLRRRGLCVPWAAGDGMACAE